MRERNTLEEMRWQVRIMNRVAEIVGDDAIEAAFLSGVGSHITVSQLAFAELSAGRTVTTEDSGSARFPVERMSIVRSSVVGQHPQPGEPISLLPKEDGVLTGLDLRGSV